MPTQLSCRSQIRKGSRKSGQSSMPQEALPEPVSHRSLFYVVMAVYMTAGLLSATTFLANPSEKREMVARAPLTVTCESEACPGLHFVTDQSRPPTNPASGL